eukprot:1808506-Rhodomonas_salina.1
MGHPQTTFARNRHTPFALHATGRISFCTARNRRGSFVLRRFQEGRCWRASTRTATSTPQVAPVQTTCKVPCTDNVQSAVLRCLLLPCSNTAPCYAVPGTETGYAATRLCRHQLLSAGSGLLFSDTRPTQWVVLTERGAAVRSTACRAVCGTELAYGAITCMRCL